MKILVAVKYSPDPYQVKIHARTGTLLIEDVDFAIPLKEYYAIHAALKLKESTQGEVTAVTIGTKASEEAVREALGFGVDKGVLIHDKALAVIDSITAATILSEYVKKKGGVDVIIAGTESSDYNGGLFATTLAGKLGYAFAVNVRDISVEGNKLKVVQDFFPKSVETELETPAVISVSHRIGDPTYPNAWSISEAYQDGKVEYVALSDLGLDEKIAEKYVKIRRFGEYSEEEGVRRRLSGSKEEITKSIAEMLLEYL